MNPENYFRLYTESVKGALACKNCLNFKIGGPSLSTMNSQYMDTFLNYVKTSSLKLDFISWHSYQKRPKTTIREIETLLSLPSFRALGYTSEKIISEWGPTPEISLLYMILI